MEREWQLKGCAIEIRADRPTTVKGSVVWLALMRALDRAIPSRILAFLLAAGLLCGAAAVSEAQTSVVPSQRDVILNASPAGVANTAVVVTLAAVANQRNRLYSFKARCSAGTSTVTVAYTGFTWTTPTGAITTVDGSAIWMPAPLTATTGVAMTVTLATCGAGNTGTLVVQADRY